MSKLNTNFNKKIFFISTFLFIATFSFQVNQSNAQNPVNPGPEQRILPQERNQQGNEEVNTMPQPTQQGQNTPETMIIPETAPSQTQQQMSTVRRMQQDRLQQFEQRRLQLKQQNTDRESRINAIRADQQQRVNDAIQRQINAQQLRSDQFQGNFSDAQINRIRVIKHRNALVIARFSRAVDQLYRMVSRLENMSAELRSSGFGSNISEAQLDSVTGKLEAIERELEGLSVIFDEVEGMSEEEIRAALQEAQTSYSSLKGQLQGIKIEVITLVQL